MKSLSREIIDTVCIDSALMAMACTMPCTAVYANKLPLSAMNSQSPIPSTLSMLSRLIPFGPHEPYREINHSTTPSFSRSAHAVVYTVYQCPLQTL